METLCNNFIRYCGRLSGAKAHRIYFLRFVLCEILNLVNVVGQGCNSIDIFDGLMPQLNPRLNHRLIRCLPKRFPNPCLNLLLKSSLKFQMSIELHPR